MHILDATYIFIQGHCQLFTLVITSYKFQKNQEVIILRNRYLGWQQLFSTCCTKHFHSCHLFYLV